MSSIPTDIITLARELAANAVNGMCMTMDHSFGLQDERQQRGLKLSMSQVAEHDVAPAIAKAILAERERCAGIADAKMYDFGCIAGVESHDYVTICAEMAAEIRASVEVSP